MEVSLQNVYKCDYCVKRQFRKSDMAIHEKWCKSNPNNKHKCFEFCVHLKKTEEEYIGAVYGEDLFKGKRTVFTCSITGKKMYSFIAERRKLPVINEPESIRMPLECDKYCQPDWLNY